MSAPESERPSPRGDAIRVAPTRAQRALARQMLKAKPGVPHFYVAMEVRMSAALAARKEIRAAIVGDVAPTVNDVITKAVALALRASPRANSAYVDDEVETYSRVNVALAVAHADAVFTPVVFDADTASLIEIANATRMAVTKVREGRITPDDLAGATFTLSNLGMYGVDAFSAVINPPQATILAVGSVKKRALATEAGAIEAVSTVTLTLSSDHRVLTGAHAAEFLVCLRDLLEEPAQIFDL